MSRRELFHPENERLQTIWDATSLNALMTCPEQYNLGIRQGWTTLGEKVDVEFGQAAHNGLEVFVRRIVAGDSHDNAVKAALKTVLQHSWNYEENRPKLGRFLQVWRCKGETKYKNEKGNAAKCPFSHKGKMFPAPGPYVCGKCGSETEEMEMWFPDNPAKDRINLMRLVVWYGEEVKNGHMKPVSVEKDGEHLPLVEQFWRLPFITIEGVRFDLCGNIDKVTAIGDDGYLADYKTTKNALNALYWGGFAPNVQVDLYDMVALNLLPANIRYGGVMIEAIQVLVSGVRFGYRVFGGTPEMHEERLHDFAYWLALAKEYAESGHWPRNRSACKMCGFKRVCTASPGAREGVLAENYVRMPWNPLTRTREEPENVG